MIINGINNKDDLNNRIGYSRRKGFSSSLIYLLGAILFVSCYYFVRYMLFNFEFDSSNILDSQDTLDYSKNRALTYYYLPNTHLNLIFWNLLCLVPAAILLSFFFVRTGISFNLEKIMENKVIVLSAMMIVSAVALMLTIFIVFEQVEISDDENTYDFQAKMLLEGKLFTKPPVTQSFKHVFTVSDAIYTGKYPIGHPIMLAAGMALGERYIFPILLSVLTILLVYGIYKRFYDDKCEAILASLLLMISPYFILMSSSRLSHSTTAFFLALFVFIFAGLIKKEKISLGDFALSLIAGLSAGMALFTRTLTAPAFLLPFGVYTVYFVIKNRPKFLGQALLMLLGFGVLVVLNLLYNKEVTGDYLMFPQHFMKVDPIGFVESMGHTPIKALFNSIINILKAGVHLYSFPLAAGLLTLYIFTKLNKWDILFYGSILCIIIFYGLYWTPGIYDTGPTYYYELIIPICILSARAISWAYKKFDKSSREYSELFKYFIFSSLILALVTNLPERIDRIDYITNSIQKPYSLIDDKKLNNAVVFFANLPNRAWVYDIRYNSPGFDDNVILCKLRDSTRNAAVMNHFKGRAYYQIRYDNFKDEWSLSHFSKEKNTSSTLISILAQNASDFFSSKVFTIADGKYIRNLIVIHVRKEEYDAACYYSNIMERLGLYCKEMVFLYSTLAKRAQFDSYSDKSEQFLKKANEINNKINY